MNDIVKKIYKKYLKEEFPTNNMGTSSSTSGTGNIDTFDPLIGIRNKIIKRRNPITKKAFNFKIKL